MAAYTVQDAFTLAQKMAKGIPFTGIDVTICDIVNSTIYKSYPWRTTLSVSTGSNYALTDGTQDYSVNAADKIMRVTQFWLLRTDTTPDQVQPLTVAKSLNVNLIPQSPYSIRSAAWQGGVNKLRLESAVRIGDSETWQLLTEYQPNPTKITALSNSLWFTDEYLDVFAKGLIYWAYALAERSEAGTVQRDGNGRKTYTGKLGEFISAIDDMASAEDFGNTDGYYPEDSIGAVDGRRYFAPFPAI